MLYSVALTPSEISLLASPVISWSGVQAAEAKERSASTTTATAITFIFI